MINDEQIIALLEEDIRNCTQKVMNITAGLSVEEIDELKALANDVPGLEVVTLGQFLDITQQWRTK